MKQKYDTNDGETSGLTGASQKLEDHSCLHSTYNYIQHREGLIASTPLCCVAFGSQDYRCSSSHVVYGGEYPQPRTTVIRITNSMNKAENRSSKKEEVWMLRRSD